MKSRPVAFAVLGIASGVLAVLLLVSILQTRQLTGQIQDCVKPSGSCYHAARTQRLRTVHSVNLYTVAAALCSITEARVAQPEYAALKACIKHRVTTVRLERKH